MVALTARPMWADEYAEFYEMIMKPLGELVRVDIWGVPFYSKVNTVSLKQSHPLFAMVDCHDDEAILAVQELWRAQREDIEKASCHANAVMRRHLHKQPVSVPKTLYEQACAAIFLESSQSTNTTRNHQGTTV